MQNIEDSEAGSRVWRRAIEMVVLDLVVEWSSEGDGVTRPGGQVMWSSDGQVVEVMILDQGVEWCDRVVILVVLEHGVE